MPNTYFWDDQDERMLVYPGKLDGRRAMKNGYGGLWCADANIPENMPYQRYGMFGSPLGNWSPIKLVTFPTAFLVELIKENVIDMSNSLLFYGGRLVTDIDRFAQIPDGAYIRWDSGIYWHKDTTWKKINEADVPKEIKLHVALLRGEF